MSRPYGIKNDSKRKAEESSAIGGIPEGDTLWMKYRFVKISEKISALLNSLFISKLDQIDIRCPLGERPMKDTFVIRIGQKMRIGSRFCPYPNWHRICTLL